MKAPFLDRLQHAWSAFSGANQQPFSPAPTTIGPSYFNRPDRMVFGRASEKSIVTSIYTRIAIDVASVDIRHVKVNENDQFVEYVKSGLDYCLHHEANIDQTGSSFIQDAVMSLCETGVIAIVPVDTTLNPAESSNYQISTMRVGEIVEWFPRHVRVKLYNDRKGKKQKVILPKSQICIVENPLYAVMNEPNSTLKRLISKLSLLDQSDAKIGANKLDMIIQLPYVIKTEARRQQAEQRRRDIEVQLESSKLGIAYTDGSERITQLNRPVENSLQNQIEYLTKTLYAQLGLTEEVFNGTADEKAMLNYFNRTIKPILNAITENMSRKFLTKTARTQGQAIMYFRDAFSLVPVENLAEIADKFTRNEILSSNEVRAIMGLKPSDDPRADELRNKNLNPSDNQDYQEEDVGE